MDFNIRFIARARSICLKIVAHYSTLFVIINELKRFQKMASKKEKNAFIIYKNSEKFRNEIHKKKKQFALKNYIFYFDNIGMAIITNNKKSMKISENRFI